MRKTVSIGIILCLLSLSFHGAGICRLCIPEKCEIADFEEIAECATSACGGCCPYEVNLEESSCSPCEIEIQPCDKNIQNDSPFLMRQCRCESPDCSECVTPDMAQLVAEHRIPDPPLQGNINPCYLGLEHQKPSYLDSHHSPQRGICAAIPSMVMRC